MPLHLGRQPAQQRDHRGEGGPRRELIRLEPTDQVSAHAALPLRLDRAQLARHVHLLELLPRGPDLRRVEHAIDHAQALLEQLGHARRRESPRREWRGVLCRGCRGAPPPEVGALLHQLGEQSGVLALEDGGRHRWSLLADRGGECGVRAPLVALRRHPCRERTDLDGRHREHLLRARLGRGGHLLLLLFPT